MKIATATPSITKINNNGVGEVVKKAANSLSDVFGNIKNVISTSLKLNITPNNHGHGTSWVYYNYIKKDNITHTGNKASNVENNLVENDINLTKRLSFATIHQMMSPWPESKYLIAEPLSSVGIKNAASQECVAKKTAPTPGKLSVKIEIPNIAFPSTKQCDQIDHGSILIDSSLSGKITLHSENELMNNRLFRRQAERHKRP